MKVQVKQTNIKNLALTIGSCYQVLEATEAKYKITNDLGKSCWYKKDYFKLMGGKQCKPLIAKKKHWKKAKLAKDLNKFAKATFIDVYGCMFYEQLTGLPKEELTIVSFKTGKELKNKL